MAVDAGVVAVDAMLGGVVGEIDGERLGADVVVVGSHDIGDGGVANVVGLDAVGDLEPGVLAQVLDAVDDLAREPLPAPAQA